MVDLTTPTSHLPCKYKVYMYVLILVFVLDPVYLVLAASSAVDGLEPRENVEIELRHSDLCHFGSPLAADRCLFLRRGTKKCRCAVLCVLILTLFLGGRARGSRKRRGLGGDRALFLGRGSRKLDALSFVLLILTLFLFHACREGVLCPFLVSEWRGVDACSCFACG